MPSLEDKVKDLERLVNIHETFFKEQYSYDKTKIYDKFEELEEQIKDIKKSIEEVIG